jgi:caffeoyl-CoA O-methyltransferase
LIYDPVMGELRFAAHAADIARRESHRSSDMALTLVPEEIESYAAAHSTPLPPLLDELTATTEREMGALSRMISGQLEGTLLQTLLFAMDAKRVLEIGMFTGFSAQMMAAALPDDGRIVTCDIEPRHIAIAKQFFARSPHGHKIEVREGPALDTLKTLEPRSFDFVFIDADKRNYINYYEASLPLLAQGGTIAVDNVLWSGRVLDPKEEDDRAIVAFNDHVRADARVTSVLLSVRDGVMVIRRR